MKLKNCPFCGGKAVLVSYYPKNKDRRRYQIYCDNLECRMTSIVFSSKTKVFKIWDRRAKKNELP